MDADAVKEIKTLSESNIYRSVPPAGLRLRKLKGYLRMTLREITKLIGEDEAQDVIREFFPLE